MKLRWLLFLIPLVVSAQTTVFTWGGSGLVTSQQLLRDGAGTSFSPDTGRAFSTAAMTPDASVYFGATLYGGYRQASGNDHFASAGIWDSAEGANPIAGTDTLEVRYNNSSDRNTSFYFLAMHELAAPVTVDASSQFAVTGRAVWGATVSVRTVIEAGGQYFVSGSLNSLAWSGNGTNTTSATTLTFSNLQNYTWLQYDPTSSFLAPPASGTGSPDFSAVTDVGFLFNRGMGAAGAEFGVAISGMSVTATAIPEPSTYAALAGLAALGLAVRRRRAAKNA